MAGRLADSDANNSLDVRFGAAASTAPGTYYVGLSSTPPTNAGGNITEPVGGNYARVAVANNPTNWPPATARGKANGTTISFPTATANWGTFGWFILMDAPTGGTMRGWGDLSTAQTISNGGAASFAAGALTLSA